MPLREIQEPLVQSVVKSALDQASPYSRGKFRKRRLPGSEDDVKPGPVVLEYQSPSFGQRVGNLLWVLATAMGVVATVKHYEAIEAALVNLFKGLMLLLG
jgi:hypothetical protein